MSGTSAAPHGTGHDSAGPWRWRPWVRRRGLWRLRVTRGAELLVLVFAVYLGGVGATSLFPTTVQTKHYSAEVRLSALPTLTSTIHSPTSFGDLDLEFTSAFLAPEIGRAHV